MPKKPPRRERTDHIYGTTAGEVSNISVTIDERTGEIQFNSTMIDTYFERSYERPKGPKVVSRIPQASNGLTFDSSTALFGNYDFLCAVDTNTRIIKDQKISAVGVIQFQKAPPPEGAREYWKIDMPFCMEFVGLKVEKPETFGWLAALEELHIRKIITTKLRVGIVVDSDLGSISDYNARRKPFFENYLLPSHVQLIYASADTGGESLLNQTFKIADSVSAQSLDAVATGKIPPNLERIDHKYYDGIRVLYKK